MKTILLFLTCIPLFSIAQNITTKATTENGQAVILKSDGTWKYANTTASDAKILPTKQTPAKPSPKTTTGMKACEDLVEHTEDKVTGSVTFAAKYPINVPDKSKGAFQFIMVKSKETTIMSIYIINAGSCIDEDAKINILFTDGTREEVRSTNDFNCQGKVTIYMGGIFGNDNLLQQFKTKEIATMRISTRSSYEQQDFSNRDALDIKGTLICLNN